MVRKLKDVVTNINVSNVENGFIGANFYTEDDGSAYIRITIKDKNEILDFTKTNMIPRLDLFAQDGSIFTDEPLDILYPRKGVIQYKVRDNVIQHVGKMDAKLFLANDKDSIHVANFYFTITDSGMTGPIGKEVHVDSLQYLVEKVMKENAMGLLDDSFKEKLETDLKTYVNENPDKFKGSKGEDGKDGKDGGITQVHINPIEFGASPAADWQKNRDAIQKAIDICADNGGGNVALKSGTYLVKGLEIKNNVTLSGDSVTLKNPDGLFPDIIKSYSLNTQATINDDNKTLTLKDYKNIEKGSVIAVRAGRGMHYSQKTTLVNDIDSTQTAGIKLQSTYGFVAAGYMVLGNEVISYSGISNSELTGVERGIFGTAPEPHSQGSNIGIATRFYTTIADIKENGVVTLETEIPFKIKNSDVTIGVINPKIKDIRLDGNRIQGGAPSEVHPIKFELTRFGLIENVTIQNGESGIMARNGNHDLLVSNPTFIDCGVVEKTFGSGGWLFRANRRCKYINVTAVGKMWTGVYFDDRTSTGLEWDEENYDCVLDGLYAKLDRLSENLGFAIVGGIRNVAKNCKISGPRTGFSCTSNSQGVGYSDYNGMDNICQDIQIDNVYQPNILKAQRTKLYNVSYDSNTTAYKKFVDSREDTLYTSCGSMDNIKTTYVDGTYNTPSYAFTKDPTTGFYRIADGSIQFVSQGVLNVRFISNGIQMIEGKDFAFGGLTGSRIGTSPGQKIGFYGATPIKQPSKINTVDNSATQQDVINQLNSVISALNNLGLIGN